MVIFSTNKKNTGKKKEKIVCAKMMLEKNVCGKNSSSSEKKA